MVKKQLRVILIIMLLVSMTMVVMVPMINVTSASPETYIYVDPSEVTGKSIDDIFLIKIYVNNAPPTDSWEVYVSWDPTVLNVSYKKEDASSFLKRGIYTTNFITTPSTPPWDAANDQGWIKVASTLQGDVPSASGNGELFRLGFTVTGNGSSVLNLYKTLLGEVVEAELVSAYYPNKDGFFSNVDIHDIAVTSVTANTSEVSPGESVNVTVAVENEGNYTETFDVTVYADIVVYNMTVDWWPDEIVVGDEITVGTQTGIALDAGNSTTLPDFTWDTTGLEAETYTISANVTLTSPPDDDPRDNMFIDGQVTVLVPTVEVGWIEGTVTDTAVPLEGATVSADAVSDVTDSSGFYSLEVSPGTYEVTAAMTGYETQTVMDVSVVADTITTQDFALSPVVEVVTIDTLIAQVEDFYEQGKIDKSEIATSLLDKLYAAKAKIDAGKTKPAKNILGAFINHVKAQRGKHIYPPEDADILIANAQIIINNLLNVSSSSATQSYAVVEGSTTIGGGGKSSYNLPSDGGKSIGSEATVDHGKVAKNSVSTLILTPYSVVTIPAAAIVYFAGRKPKHRD